MPSRQRGQRRPRDLSGRDGGGQLPWAVIYYRAPDQTVPALEFLDGCPGTIDAQFMAVLDAVAAAPPPRFSGGGMFCLLENGTGDELTRRGLPRPAIAVITGMRKSWRTVFSERDYQRVQ
jgi:hypothetical protein